MFEKQYLLLYCLWFTMTFSILFQVYVKKKKMLTAILGFPGGSDSKESACDVGDQGSIPGSGRFPWRKAWLPTPSFLPGESHGQRSLAGHSSWAHKESDTTECLTLSLSNSIVNRGDIDPKAAKIGSWGQRKLTQWLGTAQKVPVEKYTECNLYSATWSCLILWDPMDRGLSGFSLHWISQARILVWVVISYSRGSSSLRDQTQVFCISCIGRHFFFKPLSHLKSPVNRSVCL